MLFKLNSRKRQNDFKYLFNSDKSLRGTKEIKQCIMNEV